MIVIDASMAAAIGMPNEPDPPSLVLRRLYGDPLIAPAHWPVEIGNIVVIAERRGRITRAARQGALSIVAALSVEIVPFDADAGWGELLSLADQHGLTVYDAAYLQLALGQGAALASNDRELVDVARGRGVDVLTSLP